MTTAIWILKAFTSILFTFTGFLKVLLHKDDLLAKGMKGLVDLDERQIKVAGALEVLGAVGLILPALLNIYPVLSSVAALGLAVTMIVAGWINHKLNLSVIPNIVIFVICVFIAWWELR
ncbi:MAG TPA: DoxX family protein [Cyclobacteriaceae bacterium]|nr:DoxX family protein [Cyclobacteriaceae bacterium]